MNFDVIPQYGSPLIPPGREFFGLIVPGGPLRTNFSPVDNTGLKFSMQLAANDLPGPLPSITELVFFLLPNIPLPHNHGVVCYWQIAATVSLSPGQPPPSTGFELLGATTPDRPSIVFQTRWSEHEQALEATNSGQPVVVTIGVSLEPLDSIRNLSSFDPFSQRLFVAEKIAMDLFKFMQSFDTGTAGSSQMVVPKNIFDRWFQRFENRFRRDPNFFLRSSDA